MPNKNGLILVMPTSTAVTGGGTATISANGSVLFSACATLSLNGVFSADYDNYMVVCRYDTTSNGRQRYRLRVGGVDNATASSYVTQTIETRSTTVLAERETLDTGEIAYTLGDGDKCGLIINFYGPYLTQPTAWRTLTSNNNNDGAGAGMTDKAGTHNQSASYDGFTLIQQFGTISGRIAVYGIRN